MYLEDPYKILFAEESFNNCTKLRSINISTNNNIEIYSLAFGNYTSMERMNVHTGGKVTVHDYAFNGCKSSDNIIIEANETNISTKAYGDNLENNGNKKKHGSSHKNNDDISEISAKTYHNFKIQSVYLGTSPNIYANLNIFADFMKRIRKTFGHIVPSPEFIHSAIWVGPKNATDDTYGAIFVYGKYYNIYKLDSYLKEDGAKAYVMKLKDFKVRYPLIDPIKLTSKRNIKLYDFIYEVENSGKLRASDYNWPTNNCQHFTAKLINILHAIRATPDKDDWINIPKVVLNSLQSNEND